MHNSKIVVALLAILGIVSCFMPWTNRLYFGEGSIVSGIYFSDGVFALLYFALILVVCFFNDRKAALPGKLAGGIAITAILPAFLIGYHYFVINAQAARMQNLNVDISNFVVSSPAHGIITALTAISLIVLVLVIVVVYNNRHLFKPASFHKEIPANYVVAS